MSLYFAPALLSKSEIPLRLATNAATAPQTSRVEPGEHSVAGQASTGQIVKAPTGGVVDKRVKEAYGRLPIAFEDNAGQYDGKVKYSARGTGFQLFLTSDEAVLALNKPSAPGDRHEHDPRGVQEAIEQSGAAGSGSVLRMKLVGANERARVSGEDRLAAKSNYFVGAQPETWHTGVAMFEKVRYAEVYPGVDVVYYGNQRQLEYDFILAPRVDPARIKFKFSGAREVRLDAEGHLSLQTDGGFVRQDKPVIYQLVNGRRQEIAGKYAINKKGEIGFEVGRYDRSQLLVIDPVLSYSTYLGGSGNDQALSIALDREGNAYITGQTASANFPSANPFQAVRGNDIDAFVLKLNPAGNALVYATYLGGNGNDIGNGIAVDAAGNAYVTGQTLSNNFPRTFGTVQTSNAGWMDAFITKLNAEGNGLIYSSYLGGENFDEGYGIALDAAGNAYVTGSTDSNSFLGGAPMPKQGSAVYKSGDAGVTWSPRKSGLPEVNIASITIDPTNSGILYAAASSGVYKSFNGGDFWNATGQGSSVKPLSATSVVVDPSAPATLYAGTFGGVYKSTNGGNLWNESSAGLQNSAGFVFCLALDPNNTSTLYAGTFSGVYKSADGGASWVRSSSGFAPNVNRINKIIFNPTDSKILYAATNLGVYKSTNGATNWSAVSNGLPSTSGGALSVTSLAISPASPATMYAGTTVGVFKSTDGGLNWVAANDGLRVQTNSGTLYIPPITAIVISHAEASTVYASSWQGGVFKSTDGGANWAASSNGLANIYVNNLTIDPSTAATLYASVYSYSDAFVIKINATGADVGYLRYLGGNEFDEGRSIAVDASGNAYLTGETRSINFETLNPVQASGGGVVSDAFVTKLGTDGSTLYATYLGGHGADIGLGIAVNAAGNAHVTGSTNSTNFPTAGARQTTNTFGTEAFVSKLSASGSSLDYSIYHGGTSTDQGFGIALDGSGNAYVTGATSSSTSFPVLNGVQAAYGGSGDAFVLKLSPSSEVIYSTYVGGIGNEQSFGIATDAAGGAYIAGSTTSPNFPTVSPLQSTAAGGSDAFIARIAPSVDLSVTMTDAPDPLVLGSDLTYTIRVANVGELTATGVRLNHVLPAGSVLVSANAGTGACSGTNPVNCELGSLASGASVNVTVVIKPPGESTVTSTASVTASEPEANTANNTASARTHVGFADLKVTKTVTHDLIKAGAKIFYIINVRNAAGIPTDTVTLTDNLPAGLTFVACSSPGRAVCGGTGNNRTATIPSLAVGESESIILTAVVDDSVAAGTLISNTATGSSDVPDPNPADNQSTAVATVTDTPIRPLSNGKIAYTSTAGGLGVKVVNVDGTGKMTFSDGAGYARRPSWSPDGSKIAFWVTSYASSIPENQVRVVNADGTGLQIVARAVSNGTNITWLPNGTHLAFIGGNGSIYIVRPDGTGLTKLIEDSTFISSLDWSPDGRKIAFIRSGALYVMDIDGSNRIKLSGDPANITYSPSWSPDGTKILFMREHAAYTVDADGTNETRLFNVPTSEATWSPDGAKLVFASGSIYIINLDGTDQIEVTNDSGASNIEYGFAPDWQPLPNASPTPTPTPKPTYTISGRVDRRAFPNSIVQVALSGTINSMTMVDDNGNYSFVRLPAGGNYTVAPASNFFNFEPQSRTFNNLSANQTNVNFAISGVTNYSVSGRVADTNGAPLSNVEITLVREGFLQGTTFTRQDGSYAFSNLSYGRTYTVYVSLSSRTNYEFEPDAVPFSPAAGGNVVNFVGTPRNSFQFQTDPYIVAEGAGRVTVVVTRAGIPSTMAAPASVTVKTFDDPAAVPCDPTIRKPDGTAYQQGLAYARCDYATTIETLTFAPGETQKTLDIPIIDDAHVEGTEIVSVRLSNAAGATIGRLSGINVVIHDNDSGSPQNPVLSTGFFVRQHYLDFLSREPEAGEPWSGVLNRCPDVNADPSCDRILVSQSFFGSPEFRLKGFYVFNFYRVAFGRRPTYEEIIPDMRSVTGATGQEVYGKRAAFPVSFTGRPEFKGLYDALGDTAFVDALLDRYQLQQIRTPDPSNPEGGTRVVLTRADLAGRLGTSGAQSLTRAQVLRAIVESDEVGAAEYNKAFVAMQYYGYLRRSPEEDGYQAWLRVINQDPNNIRVMVNGFMNSTEYKLRFGRAQ